MKNILIATDFSKEAYCALHYTAELFREADTKYIITNFYGHGIPNSVYSIVNEEEFVQAAKYSSISQDLCKETMHQVIRDTGLPGERFEILSSERKLESGLPGLIKEKKIDLVVMGTKKHQGSLSAIQETHTTRIINKGLSCPLLIIPRELDYKGLSNIAFASDLRKPISEKSIQLLIALAGHFGSRVYVVYDGDEHSLNKSQWEHFNSFKTFFKEGSVSLQCSSTHIEISKSIAEFVKKEKIDLLSMIFYKHNFAGNIFREPVIENLDRHLSFPFLILPDLG